MSPAVDHGSVGGSGLPLNIKIESVDAGSSERTRLAGSDPGGIVRSKSSPEELGVVPSDGIVGWCSVRRVSSEREEDLLSGALAVFDTSFDQRALAEETTLRSICVRVVVSSASITEVAVWVITDFLCKGSDKRNDDDIEIVTLAHLGESSLVGSLALDWQSIHSVFLLDVEEIRTYPVQNYVVSAGSRELSGSSRGKECDESESRNSEDINV